jgi:NTP pyrophosphatase (non-canonical NTP hydrolase)
MDFKEYQKAARRTADYLNVGNNFIYPTLGLAGEAGEVANKVKKIDRDQRGALSDEVKKGIAKEMGDTLWYLATLATEFGLSLDDIAVDNIKKLASRSDRGIIRGDGDNR